MIQQPHTAPINSLPPQPTPFVGRDEELAELRDLLATPDCRLLTLVGPGGIGKTRLAVEGASRQIANYSDGVFFVDLQPVGSRAFLVSAFAEAARCPMQGTEEPEEQLLAYLRDKQMLLVVDNFEHLLDCLDLLSGLLAAAPALKLLVTSREVLNVQEEWIYTLHGMSFPASTQTSDAEAYSAVHLFVERARRIRHDFSLADEQAGVARICQLVEGMPLAIELAASWVKTLRCAAIAAEIQRGVDFLTSNVRNVPERHRSMQAAFEQSWRGLTPREREAFMRLSVFRGGFGREAAEAVARADLQVLSALGDKSLVQHGSDGRYHIHELLRQYAEERLRSEPEEALGAHKAHCRYFVQFLDERYAAVNGGGQRQAIAEIQSDLDNIRSAWQWAVERADAGALCKAALTFYYYCQFRSRYREGVDALEKAVSVREATSQAGDENACLAGLLSALGWLYIRLGDLDKARDSLERSDRAIRSRAARLQPGMGSDPCTALGILHVILGNYDEAATLGEQARRDSEARNDPFNLMFSYYVLTSAYRSQGDYERARQSALRACDIARQIDNQWFLAYCLNELGSTMRALGEYDEARAHYQASYHIKEDFGDPEGMAVALNHLGDVALLQGSYIDAKRLYEQSIARYKDLGDQGGLAQTMYGLGRATCELHEYSAARQYFKSALETATKAHIIPLTLTVMVAVADLLARTGRVKRGVEVLNLVLNHPAASQETRNSAERTIETWARDLAPEALAQTRNRARFADFETTTDALRYELGAEEQSIPPADVSLPAAAINTVDRLTAREVEVLRLVAEGLPNREIADRLIITEGTVKWYISQITSKLGAKNRTQAVARARELGLPV